MNKTHLVRLAIFLKKKMKTHCCLFHFVRCLRCEDGEEDQQRNRHQRSDQNEAMQSGLRGSLQTALFRRKQNRSSPQAWLFLVYVLLERKLLFLSEILHPICNTAA